VDQLVAAGTRNRAVNPETTRVLAVTRDAPGGAREVAAVSDAWGAGRVSALAESAATLAAVEAAAPRFDLVHFAVHATVDTRDPTASYLHLAPGDGSDGRLNVTAIASRPIRADLVVLSACESGAGPVYRGEGVLGLARAFVMAGAGAVVATRWPVGDVAADVMGAFYRDLAAGQPAEDAVRGAALAERRDPRTAHPFYWAGWMLIEGTPR